MADLLVEGEEGELHGAGHHQGHPDAVQHVAVGEESDVEVRCENLVGSTNLFISKKGVWHPDLAGVGHRQIFDLVCKEPLEEIDWSIGPTLVGHGQLAAETESGIVPCLAQGDLELVLLGASW